jgi:hypothetical protein
MAQDHMAAVLRPGLAERAFSDGEYLIRQGDQGTHLLYILEGTADVLLKLALPRHEQQQPSSASQRRCLARLALLATASRIMLARMPGPTVLLTRASNRLWMLEACRGGTACMVPVQGAHSGPFIQ